MTLNSLLKNISIILLAFPIIACTGGYPLDDQNSISSDAAGLEDSLGGLDDAADQAGVPIDDLKKDIDDLFDEVEKINNGGGGTKDDLNDFEDRIGNKIDNLVGDLDERIDELQANNPNSSQLANITSFRDLLKSVKGSIFNFIANMIAKLFN